MPTYIINTVCIGDPDECLRFDRGVLAEMERELIVERTRAGLAAARDRG